MGFLSITFLQQNGDIKIISWTLVPTNRPMEAFPPVDVRISAMKQQNQQPSISPQILIAPTMFRALCAEQGSKALAFWEFQTKDKLIDNNHIS